LGLRGLLFELRSENLHPFLLQSDCRFQLSDTGLLLLDFFVLFESRKWTFAGPKRSRNRVHSLL
jgi:hypothetical protein